MSPELKFNNKWKKIIYILNINKKWYYNNIENMSDNLKIFNINNININSKWTLINKCLDEYLDIKQ